MIVIRAAGEETRTSRKKPTGIDVRELRRIQKSLRITPLMADALIPKSEVQRQTVGAVLWCRRADGPDAGCIQRCRPEGRKDLCSK